MKLRTQTGKKVRWEGWRVEEKVSRISERCLYRRFRVERDPMRAGQRVAETFKHDFHEGGRLDAD